MGKHKIILKNTHFWLWFPGAGILAFAIETFFLGLWSIPIVDYQIAYMSEITDFDMIFTVAFALLFGFGTALFILARSSKTAGCTVGSAAGLTALFTLLCPVCPIFFLTYFGLSASLLIIAPYFWWLRLVAVVLMLIGIAILWRRFELKNLPELNRHAAFHKMAGVAIILLFLGNQAIAIQLGEKMMGPQPGEAIELSGDFAQDIAALVTPNSIPFYGPELGLDFSSLDNINKSIEKMSVMAPQQGSNPIELTDGELKRYVAIGTENTITCEFCCGVKTLVREDGSPTCGCAHSIAMRGTAAYLIKNYPEMTNADIAYELMRQKGLYFPKQMQERMANELAGDTADFTPDIGYLTMYLSEAELKDLQQKAQSSGFTPDETLDMVGGC